MKTLTKTFIQTAISAAIISTTLLMAASEVTTKQETTSKLLTANFESRQVVQIEAGDFHFIAGQVAPIHTHSAPAVGYVSKGAIIYQIEGEEPQLLNEGDAFYEPVGPRILRFDNASATEEAVFIDFNLQQAGEPFIVFEKPLTENIDRRTLPTTDLKDQKLQQVDMFITELEQGGLKKLNIQVPILGYVAEGVINLKIKGQAGKRIVAGSTFSLSESDSIAVIVNDSDEVTAKVVSFYLR